MGNETGAHQVSYFSPEVTPLPVESNYCDVLFFLKFRMSISKVLRITKSIYDIYQPLTITALAVVVGF